MPAPMDEKHDQKALAAVVELFVVALSPFPLFAIKQACELAMRGKVGATGGRFRPNPAELALACEREMQFFVKERKQINDILQADMVEDRPEESTRKRLTESAKNLIKQLASARPPNEVARGLASEQVKVDDGLTPQERAEKRLEELRGQPLPMLSAEALAAIKRNVVVDE
jgi:hypothetical protein